MEFEAELQKFKPNVTIPYWDWMRNDGRDIDRGVFKTYFGSRDQKRARIKGNWEFERGSEPWAPLPESFSEQAEELLSETFFEFRRAIEYGGHAAAHGFIGGDMASGKSPADPLFYLLHSNIDRLWAYWQHNHLNEPQYSTEMVSGEIQSTAVAPDETMIGGATPMDMVRRKGFTYLYRGDVFYMIGIALTHNVVYDVSDEFILENWPFPARIATRFQEREQFKPKPSPPPIHVPKSIKSIFGNRRSHNFHRVNCTFKRRMVKRNVVSFPSIKVALTEGYDGCAFCCRKYHTR